MSGSTGTRRGKSATHAFLGSLWGYPRLTVGAVLLAVLLATGRKPELKAEQHL